MQTFILWLYLYTGEGWAAAPMATGPGGLDDCYTAASILNEWVSNDPAFQDQTWALACETMETL